jgi:hypothetical protein
MTLRRSALIVMAAMTALFVLAALPSTATLAARAGAGGSTATLTSVSCASAGNCAVGGSYEDASFRPHAFVISERNSSWGKIIEVSGERALRFITEVSSVSCPAPGSCAAVGGNAALRGQRGE